MEKFNKWKSKFADSLPRWEVDQINHYQFANFLAMLLAVFSVVAKQYLIGLIGILTIIAVAIVWELYTLIQDKFSKKSIKESINDMCLAGFAVFGYFVILLILNTQD